MTLGTSMQEVMTKSKNVQFGHRYNYGARYPEGLDLRPGSEKHGKLLEALLYRATLARDALRGRFDSWNDIDKTLTAYIDLSEDEETLKNKDPRNPVSIVVPVTYATMETLLTFLSAAFLNSPIFRYDPVGEEDVIGAAMLERVIESHCHRFKLGLRLHTLWRDGLAYNCGIGSPVWTVKRGRRRQKTTRYQMRDPMFYSVFAPMEPVEQMETVDTILYEGTELLNIDPYQFLPDPNVSIDNVGKGEFCGWIGRTNRMELITQELDDPGMFNVKYLEEIDGRSLFMEEKPDERDRYNVMYTYDSVTSPVDVLYLYANIVPREWELGPSKRPEKWVFWVAGDSIIVKAHPLDLNHDMYPVAVCAPDYDGHSLAPISRLEVMNGMQRTVDFLYNSHFANVRKAINDMFLVDPQVVVMNDLKNPYEGLLIRVRQKFWGQGKLDQAVKQFNVQDVTAQHMADVPLVNAMIEKVTGATENMQGIRRQTSERVSAREAQNVQMNAMSRMENTARVISMMTMQPLAYMFAHNAQQFLEVGEWVKITGRFEEDLRQIFPDSKRAYASPADLAVEFDVVEHDGSVPGSGDPQTLLMLWQAASQNPYIAQSVDLLNMFFYIAKASGAKNVQDFQAAAQRMPQPTVMPNEQVQQQVQQGNMIPLQQAVGGI